MGGRSSSSSQQTSQSQNFDERIAATDNAIVARDGGVVYRTTNTLDGGAINRAFDFADEIGGGALDFVSEVQANFVAVTEAANTTANRAFDFVTEQNETVEQNILKSLTPWIVVAVAVVVMTRQVKL
ncbi:hypothetical protein QMT40_001446 [Parvibaculaceae bacterium PLY_AMNH_Bact1]|nr:hypothetical protein QMT40_001446 [Parvibaculaceae bacterium PLY_AMNH_Bact1]